MLRRLSTRGLLAAAALILPACGEDQGYRFPVHPASGQVTRGGKPVAGAFVRFEPVDPRTIAMPEGEQGLAVVLTAETDADGRFSMSTYVADDGVPAGEYKVLVLPGPGTPKEGELEASIENSDGPALPVARPAGPAIPPIYRDPATTTLKAVVRADADNRFDFPLD